MAGRHPIQVWEFPMPRIADQYVDCAVYVYRSEEDAQNGVNRGGSGFIATVPLRDDLNARSGHPYIVTILHVVEKAGNPVIRLISLTLCLSLSSLGSPLLVHGRTSGSFTSMAN